MPNSIIEAEAVSKLYRLGDISSGSIRHDLNRWWARLNGKEDPLRMLAEENDRSSASGTGVIWSLKEINFSVMQGEVFGIIGRNGSGKSTLLKILSKITRPTSGTIRIGGRIASLLEVGTGFHPDLSGRENIFLNGAILGMRKHEIRAKFDEIVDFSGIERYLDTPVKRYSSGMFVRLAFAVAAHLEPEILIIDEVLAVGDADFQQKCLGKMKQVSQADGRTVIFVSHNLAAVKKLCTTGMLLEKGVLKIADKISKVLELYQYANADIDAGVRKLLPQSGLGAFTEWTLVNQRSRDSHACFSGEMISIAFTFMSISKLNKCDLHFIIRYDGNEILVHSNSLESTGQEFTLTEGVHHLFMHFELPVRQGVYSLEVGLRSEDKWIDTWLSTTPLKVLDNFTRANVEGISSLLQVKTSFTKEKIQNIGVIAGQMNKIIPD